MGWPGLSSEVRKICQQIGVSDINSVEVNKNDIEESIFFHNYKEMKENFNKYD